MFFLIISVIGKANPEYFIFFNRGFDRVEKVIKDMVVTSY